MKVFFISVAVLAAVYATYHVIKKQKSDSPIGCTTKTVEGTLPFDDVVSFFKSKNLNSEIHVPFVAKSDCEKYSRMVKQDFAKTKDGYNTLVVGVYNQNTDKIEDLLVIYAKDFDQQTMSVLGNEELVVLN